MKALFWDGHSLALDANHPDPKTTGAKTIAGKPVTANGSGNVALQAIGAASDVNINGMRSRHGIPYSFPNQQNR